MRNHDVHPILCLLYLCLCLCLTMLSSIPHTTQALHDFTARRQWMSLPPPATGERAHRLCMDWIPLLPPISSHLFSFLSS